MKKYNVTVETIMTDFVEVTDKKTAEYEMSKIYSYVEYDRDDIHWCGGESNFKAEIDDDIMFVVSTLYDYVEVEAENEEEAKHIAKRAISKIYEYVEYDSDVINWLYGDTKIKTYVEEN